MKSFGNIYWFTNCATPLVSPLLLTEKYSPDKYPKYDNYNAIEVGKVSKIPKDYLGVMGVPLTFLTKHSTDQFEIVGITLEPKSIPKKMSQIITILTLGLY